MRAWQSAVHFFAGPAPGSLPAQCDGGVACGARGALLGSAESGTEARYRAWHKLARPRAQRGDASVPRCRNLGLFRAGIARASSLGEERFHEAMCNLVRGRGTADHRL
jgi:hypothetical protein